MTASTPGLVAALAVVSVVGCGSYAGSGPGCRPVADAVALPAPLVESSGVAVSRARPGVFWTLNDGSDGTLYAVDAAGALVDSVSPGAHAWDWEDLALAPCPTGDCLWIADIGDNYRERSQVAVYRVTEPAEGGRPGPVEEFIFRYPDGARDAEAIFVLPGERLFVVTKGSNTPPTLYRYPPPLRHGVAVELEVVQRLDSGSRPLPRQITGAAASSDGSIVALRTYETLSFFGVADDGSLRPLQDGDVSLRTLREGQGEAVALGPDGQVVLTSEAGPLGRRGSMVVLTCELPDPGAPSAAEAAGPAPADSGDARATPAGAGDPVGGSGG